MPSDFQATYDDLTIGSGTGFEIDENGIEGLDLPGLRTSDTARALDHGERAGRDLLEGRTFALSLTILADDDATMSERIGALAAATVPRSTETQFAYSLPGQGERVIFARPRRRSMAEDRSARLARAATVSLEFHATDPRIYGIDENSAATPFPIASGGASWSLSWPVAWGTTSGSGALQVDNDGTFESPWIGQIDAGDGFVTGPRIENVTTGQTLDFRALTLQPGQFLKLDAYERTADLNGEASRYGSLSSTSRWFYLQPGVNELRARARQAPAGSSFTITWRSAYI